MTVSTDIREPFRFMLEHAGYATPPGRAACALALARAERLLAETIGEDAATVTWEYDDEPYDPGDTPEDDAARYFDSGRWTGPYGCVLMVNGEHVASLWGIVFGPRDLDDPYRRVVEAELASGAEDDLRQALNDARDNAQDIIFA